MPDVRHHYPHLMNESVIRDFFLGRIDASALNRAVLSACETLSPTHDRFVVSGLDADFPLTREHALALASAAAQQALSFPALAHVAFLIIASDRFSCGDDDLVIDILHDWASPEINTPLNAATVHWFLSVLAGNAPYEDGPPPFIAPRAHSS